MQYLERHNNYTYLKKYRRHLRKNLTPAEAILWRVLKSKQMEGIKFRRQFSIGNCIVDFYCPKFRLAIELDGESHFTPEGIEKDINRDDYLNQMEIFILRFENDLVIKRTETVLSFILDKIKELEKMTLPSRSSPPSLG
jgi:very-short-patch-repair endonuclease